MAEFRCGECAVPQPRVRRAVALAGDVFRARARPADHHRVRRAVPHVRSRPVRRLLYVLLREGRAEGPEQGLRGHSRDSVRCS